jgi:uncharacterized protein (DUF736 family)
MSDYDNTNKGALFQAKEKKTDKHPDYDGSINVGGHDYWVSGWKKVSKNGNTFLSLSVKRKDGTSARPADLAKATRTHSDWMRCRRSKFGSRLALTTKFPFEARVPRKGQAGRMDPL